MGNETPVRQGVNVRRGWVIAAWVVAGTVVCGAVAFGLSWWLIDPHLENAETYVVEYATDSDFANALTKSYSSSGSKWITGLTKNATYYFRVKATSASEDYAESHYGETLCNVDESSAILDGGPLLVEFEDTNSTNSVLAARAALIAQISSGLNDEENMFETVELDLDWYSLDD